MKHTVEDVLKAAARKSFSLTRELAEKLLTQSPDKMQLGDYSVYWDDDKGELIVQLNPQLKPQLKPSGIPSKDDLVRKLKKVKRDISNTGTPSPKPPKP